MGTPRLKTDQSVSVKYGFRIKDVRAKYNVTITEVRQLIAAYPDMTFNRNKSNVLLNRDFMKLCAERFADRLFN